MTHPSQQHAGGAVLGPLPARSAAEAQVYLDLHPCEKCSTPRARDNQELREGGEGHLISVYRGVCSGCGRPWRVAFSVPAVLPAAGRMGGPEPSVIIDPGEWLYVSEQAASIPADSRPLGPADRARLVLAADAAEEVVKFIPLGDRVPDSAFTSSLGRTMHATYPDRFRKEDLIGRAQLYRAGAVANG